MPVKSGISPFRALSPRISPPSNPPPSDFDPSQSRLTFAVEGGPHNRKAARPVHIFGDSNYLGNIEITDLFRTICHRSTDGSRILFAQWPDSSSKVSSRINEYDIRELNLREFLMYYHPGRFCFGMFNQCQSFMQQFQGIGNIFLKPAQG